jgi:Spy/CpxP family protein refolding chaperone
MTKRVRWFVLALMIGSSMVAAAASSTAGEGARGEQKAPAPMTEMMRGTRMGAMRDLLGPERPLLSLALQRREELQLSADQVKTLEGLVERFRKDAEARIRQIEAAELEVASMLKADPADLSQVESKVRAIEALRADLRIARIRTITEGRAALTPEQRQKLQELAATPAPGRAAERTRGTEEMERFMNSERMPQAMNAMMEMARRMGDGDTMLGMVRMMEMMGSMGGMMGGQGGGTMGDQPGHQIPREQK